MYATRWMSIPAEGISEDKIMFITISRQFAAGGSQVARQVAEELDWRVVDDAFIEEIAG